MRTSTSTAPTRFQLVVDGDVVAEAATRAELERAARRAPATSGSRSSPADDRTRPTGRVRLTRESRLGSGR